MFKFLQSKPAEHIKNKQRIVLKVDGMHCVSCSMNIDGELEDMPGVISASTNYAKGKCIVEFDPSKVKEADLVKTIKKLGYEAQVQLVS